MSDQKIALSPFAKIRYNVEGEVTFDTGMNYLGALLIIASADGELSDAEINWLIQEQQLLGAPEELIEKIKNYDWKNANLDTLLEKIQYDFPMNARRTILYQAAKMSQADKEYHLKERQAVWRAAKALGVEADIVQTIEALVEMENATDRIRFSLIGTLVEDHSV